MVEGSGDVMFRELFPAFRVTPKVFGRKFGRHTQRDLGNIPEKQSRVRASREARSRGKGQTRAAPVGDHRGWAKGFPSFGVITKGHPRGGVFEGLID